MSNKYKSQYKIESSRLAGYDYSQNGMYFVTICTKGREEFFGRIEEGEMVLSGIGEIANQFWQEIPKHFPKVILDEYVIMPNHLHGIVEINNDRLNVDARRDEAMPRLYTGQHLEMSEISPKPGSLSVILGSFKSIVSKTTRKQLNPVTFAWQPRFYDHIIRNDVSLNKIREYIQTNPAMWERDRNNVENLWM
ncbi:MAG: transposase [Candidatus Moranbacteria bacterium]|nr:transposase [Candidatus Moranbacteria bacterium]